VRWSGGSGDSDNDGDEGDDGNGDVDHDSLEVRSTLVKNKMQLSPDVVRCRDFQVLFSFQVMGKYWMQNQDVPPVIRYVCLSKIPRPRRSWISLIAKCHLKRYLKSVVHQSNSNWQHLHFQDQATHIHRATDQDHRRVYEQFIGSVVCLNSPRLHQSPECCG
jgi:hypothetical protein